ncbi:uncharacterized protein LOC131293046 [Anopheles ziemanni]|uniref:uncharacterized protein LOC131263989 n=1 Tax=Anopheles coustani TaxID=139045 RepID=UPI00265ABBD1|nr:uncharacterized protein LOC131263989 [Anopheles coustani]XP_058177109.1 uncharacterized protein LOC131293046 [Anopheles ziemanni]
MKAFCFSLAFLCLVQTILALPRPDFGINGDVANSDKTAVAADGLKAEFILTGLKDITLTAGYTMLGTMRTKLIAIGDAIETKGTALATQLKTLSLDDVGPYTPAFGLVETKLTELETLFRTGLATLISELKTAIRENNAIKIQFDDAFGDVLATIGTFRTALGTLKTDVGKAQRAAGTSSTVSTTIIKKNIAAKSVTDVITNTRTLRANVQLVNYIINSSLENLDLADEFIVEITGDAEDHVGFYATSVSDFQDYLTIEETATLSAEVDDNEPDTVSVLLAEIDAALTAATGYTSSTLKSEVEGLGDALFNGLEAAKTAFGTSLSEYSAIVPDYFEDLNVDLGNALCLPIETVSEALAANAPNSDFCFSKYSPRVVALLSLTISAFDMCFQREVDKFVTLEEVVAAIVVQIGYNLEDLYGNLATCLLLDDPDLTSCFTTIQPYYTALATQVTEHTTTLSDLVDAEAQASENRLGACLISSLYVTIFQGMEISDDTGSCMLNGPQA